MFFIYKGIKISYKSTEGHGEPIVFLHGWGSCGDVFKNMSRALKNPCVIIDLPPFGESEIPTDFNIFTYAHMVICLLDKAGIKKASFVSHSFGSRIAIIIASVRAEIINKLIVISGAGMKPRYGLRYFLLVLKAKIYKRLRIKKELGSADYRELSPEMRVVFKNVVNEPLERFAKNIKAETLLVYGKKDKETPLYMARRLNRLIKNSRLIILKRAGHFCFLEYAIEVNRTVKSFLEGK